MQLMVNSLDKLCHTRSVAYSVELVLLNKCQISMQTNVTSPLYTIVHSDYSVIWLAFLYTLRWFLHQTAHSYHSCYALDDIFEYLRWYQVGIIWDIKLNNYHFLYEAARKMLDLERNIELPCYVKVYQKRILCRL